MTNKQDKARETLQLQAGDILPPLIKHITQKKINLYAEASGDFNPLHVDEVFARQTPLGGTIAHGMLVLAYLSEMVSQVFGTSWLADGKLSVRFKSPARPGDTITVNGKVNSLIEENGVSYASCSLECHNQKRETIITGEAKARLPQQKS